VNPDRYVAAHNVGRYESTGKIDVDYLGNALSADAAPVLVPSLSKLARADAARLRGELCARIGWLLGSDDIRSWNGARSAARAALGAAGVSPATCAPKG